jgi:5'-nucleotidase (lipoprotein e(P4) family)
MSGAEARPDMRILVASVLVVVPLVACTDTGIQGEDGPADIQGEEKADGAPGIEVTARIKPGTTDAVLTTSVPRLGYVFYAAENAKVSLEITHSGSTTGLDTLVKIYGPRLADGTYPKTLASDDDAGYGKLSKISGLAISTGGFYLAEVTFGPNATPADGKKARVKLSCDGSCDSPMPVQPMDLGLKWYRRAAEKRAANLQAYRLATTQLVAYANANPPANWAVVMDIDETSLDNSQYQQSRGELGVGYSPGSWTAWVNQKAATPIDGAVAFAGKVKALGGKLIFVSNRMAMTECPQTEDNLHAAGFQYDLILCKTDTSDKNPRFAALVAGTAKPGFPAVKPLMFVGDNILDFPGMTQDVRKMGPEAFARFGQDFIQLPNPMYGSFEKNVD